MCLWFGLTWSLWKLRCELEKHWKCVSELWLVLKRVRGRWGSKGFTCNLPFHRKALKLPIERRFTQDLLISTAWLGEINFEKGFFSISSSSASNYRAVQCLKHGNPNKSFSQSSEKWNFFWKLFKLDNSIWAFLQLSLRVSPAWVVQSSRIAFFMRSESVLNWWYSVPIILNWGFGIMVEAFFSFSLWLVEWTVSYVKHRRYSRFSDFRSLFDWLTMKSTMMMLTVRQVTFERAPALSALILLTSNW